MITEEYFQVGKISLSSLKLFTTEYLQRTLFSLENRFSLFSESHQGFDPILGWDHLEGKGWG